MTPLTPADFPLRAVGYLICSATRGEVAECESAEIAAQAAEMLNRDHARVMAHNRLRSRQQGAERSEKPH